MSEYVPRSTLSLVLATARARGWIYALNIGATIYRNNLRKALEANYARVRAVVLLLTFGAGAGLLYWLGSAPMPLDTGWHVASVAGLLLLGLTLVFIALGHALVPGRLRGQVVLALIRTAVFSLVIIGFGWFVYDGWLALWQRSAAGATLVGLITLAVLFAFKDVLNVVLQMTLVRQQVVDVTSVPSLTEEGRRRIAYHEAGHALVYALGEGIPEDATVAISTEVYGLLAGAVQTPMPHDPTEITRDFMDLRLRLLVAGKAAEDIVYDGDACMGAVQDMQVFQQQAVIYLQAGFGGGYIHEPKDEEDRRINLAAIEALRAALEAEVRAFLIANRSLLDRTAEQLLRAEFLGCEELAVLLPDAHLPSGGRRRWPPSVPLYRPE